MKKGLVAVAAFAALGAWGQSAERQKPNEAQAPNFEAMQRFIDSQPKPPPKPKLGPIDQWRYDYCRSDAAKAPTPQGVIAGMQVCREKFEQ